MLILILVNCYKIQHLMSEEPNSEADLHEIVSSGMVFLGSRVDFSMCAETRVT